MLYWFSVEEMYLEPDGGVWWSRAIWQGLSGGEYATTDISPLSVLPVSKRRAYSYVHDRRPLKTLKGKFRKIC